MAGLLAQVQCAAHHEVKILFCRAVYKKVGPQSEPVQELTLYQMDGFAFAHVELHDILVSFLLVPIIFIPVLTNPA